MLLPAAIPTLARACQAAGGHAWLVGGSVRDWLMGRTLKDFDVEVHGLPIEQLHRLLSGLGHVNEVGRSFGVFKLTLRGLTIDVSLPRRDSNSGPGHRGITVEGDPRMGLREAARRRDLTINAMLYDPLSGELVDPFGGKADLQRGLLRAVDAETFLEDPLRALRVVQFAGRFEMAVDAGLIELCRQAPLAELPAERVLGELEKLLLGAARPSLGLAVARQGRILERVLPPLAGEDPQAIDDAVDRAASLRTEAGELPRPLALMLASLLHRLAPPAAEACLDLLQVHGRARYPLRERVLGAVAAAPELAAPIADARLRALAETEELALVALVSLASTGSPLARAALQRAGELGVDRGPAPVLLRGRDLLPLGLSPGPEMGEILAAVRRAQIAGRVGTVEEALAFARHLRESGPGG